MTWRRKISWTFFDIWTLHLSISGVDAEILKRECALFRPPWLAGEKIFRFQMVLKCWINVRNYKRLAKYFYQYFQIFFIFIDKIFFSKFLIQQLVRRDKLRKVTLCVIIGCFVKPFKMIINHFCFFVFFVSLFLKVFHSAIMAFWGISKEKLGTANNWKWQIKFLFQKHF